MLTMKTAIAYQDSEFTPTIAFTIIPPSDRLRTSYRVQRHAEEMAEIVQHLLDIKNLTYSNSPTFLKDFEHNLPLVHTEFPEDTPGEISIYLICRHLKRHNLSQFFSEMIQRWVIPWGQAEIVSAKQVTFHFNDFPKKTFFVSEILCHVEDRAALLSIREKMPSIAQEIALGAISAHHARHILATKGLTLEQKTTQIHKTIIELSNRKLRPISPDVFLEMQYFLLACDDEFKRIREVRHMCRIICYHNWYRRQLRQGMRHGENKERQMRFKLLKTPLRFAFGEKKVLGIVIAVNFLSEYEQFEAKHILKACQRLLSHIRIVPHSFLCYANPSDTIHSFYIEIERKDGKDFTFDEVQLLKNGLEIELSLSIEQLSHKLFMPHN
ncbi:MAG: hypothetical protein JWO53_800, partial [Chlamydiia bacterium]|nr:hypothetical protein [Chlamydiia bacterium]